MCAASREILLFLKDVDVTRYRSDLSTLNEKVRALVDETANPNKQTPSIGPHTRSGVSLLQIPIRSLRHPPCRLQALSETSNCRKVGAT